MTNHTAGNFCSETPEQLNLRLAREAPCTDLGNVERFRDRNRGRLIYSAARGWSWWDGQRWSREGIAHKVRLAEHDCVRAIADEARALRGTEHDVIVGRDAGGKSIRRSDELLEWGIASQAASKMEGLARWAAPYLTVEETSIESAASRRLANRHGDHPRQPARGDGNNIQIGDHDAE